MFVGRTREWSFLRPFDGLLFVGPRTVFEKQVVIYILDHYCQDCEENRAWARGGFGIQILRKCFNAIKKNFFSSQELCS